jgi:hypothetical protein
MIRSVLPDDAPRIAEIYNHYIEHTAITFEEQPISFEEAARRLAEITQRLPWFVYTENGTVSGYCYASPWKSRSAYRFSVESSIYVASASGGRGVGTLLYKQRPGSRTIENSSVPASAYLRASRSTRIKASPEVLLEAAYASINARAWTSPTE